MQVLYKCSRYKHNPSFVIFTNGESCFVVERSIFEMVDRFAGRHEEITEAKPP